MMKPAASTYDSVICCALGRVRDVWLIRMLCLAAIICTIFHSAVAAEEWPVKKFKIFKGVPDRSASLGGNFIISNRPDWWEMDEQLIPANDLPPAILTEIENYLYEVAVMYESLGFKPTFIEPIVEDENGEKFFRVYYNAYGLGPNGQIVSNAPARRQSDDCDQVRPVFEINARTFFQNGSLSPKNYQDLAHEVFHGIQARYPLFENNCTSGPGDWIGEGTAQLMGADIAAYSSRNVEYPTLSGGWVGIRWGLRDYSSSLRQMKGNNAVQRSRTYGASSFWRYLGEHIAVSGAEGTKAVKPDYDFLQDIFNSEAILGQSETADMAWLDQLMLDNPAINLGFDRLYPRFLTTFAAYVNERFSPSVRTPLENQELYLAAMFFKDKCPIIKLQDYDPPVRQALKVAPFAGACFRIDPASSYPTDIEISVYDASEAQLLGLKIGTEEGAVIAKPDMLRRNQKWSASWIFNVAVDQAPPVFVVTNVGATPASTSELVATIEFSATTSVNNLATYGPVQEPVGPQQPPVGPQQTQAPPSSGANQISAPPPENTPTPGGESSASGGNFNTMESQAARVGEQIDSGLQTLNPNMAHANTVNRNPKAAACADAFKLIACGPHTTISMEMVPGMFGSLAQSTGRGGTFGQFASMLMGVNAAGPDNAMQGMRAAVEASESMDGALVNIVIPLIDYGFTGTFDNAFIRVSGKNRASYKTVGPRDVQPGPGHAFPLSGRVTIEEYTPRVLRGSYSGSLIDSDEVELTGDDQSLPVYEVIQGRFNIIATWRGDDRIFVEPAGDPVDTVINDVSEMMGGLNHDAVRAMMEAHMPDSVNNPPGSRRTVYIPPVCDCSCNAASNPQAQCLKRCGATYAACPVASPGQTQGSPADSTGNQASTKPFLQEIPDPCSIFSGEVARVLLNIPPPGPTAAESGKSGVCQYSNPANNGAMTALSFSLNDLTAVSSGQVARVNLRNKAIALNPDFSVEPFEVEGVGNYAFGFIEGQAVSVVVFTGIDAAVGGGLPGVRELISVQSILDNTQHPGEMMKNVYNLTKQQVSSLQAITK